MSYHRYLTLSAFAVLTFGMALFSQVPAADGEKPKQAPPKEEVLKGPIPPWMPGTPVKRIGDVRINGTVVSVGKEFIELLEAGKKAAVKYPAHEVLASGRIVHWETDCWCYLLGDVKVGDEIQLAVGEIGQTTFALYLSITKRPGGKIPASHRPSENRPYHEEKQAEIDFKEKGIPLPEKYQRLRDREAAQRQEKYKLPEARGAGKSVDPDKKPPAEEKKAPDTIPKSR